jgi:hypothetical protein
LLYQLIHRAVEQHYFELKRVVPHSIMQLYDLHFLLTASFTISLSVVASISIGNSLLTAEAKEDNVIISVFFRLLAITSFTAASIRSGAVLHSICGRATGACAPRFPQPA